MYYSNGLGLNLDKSFSIYLYILSSHINLHYIVPSSETFSRNYSKKTFANLIKYAFSCLGLKVRSLKGFLPLQELAAQNILLHLWI